MTSHHAGPRPRIQAIRFASESESGFTTNPNLDSVKSNTALILRKRLKSRFRSIVPSIYMYGPISLAQAQLCMWRRCLVATTFESGGDCHHHFFRVEFAIFQAYKNTNFSLYFGQENRIFLATRSVLWPKICRKSDSGRGSAPDPTGGAHDAPPDP